MTIVINYNKLPVCRYLLRTLSIASLVLLLLQQAMAYEVSVEYYHHNHQGSLLEVYDGSTNRRLLSQAWSPWGERQVLHVTAGDRGNIASLLAKGLPVRRGYTGHKTLLSTGLTFAGDTRLYDARLKRFLNSDDRTTGGVRGQNRYSYAYNNPMTFTDPDGRTPRGRMTTWVEGFLGERGKEVLNVYRPLAGLIDLAVPLLSEHARGSEYQGSRPVYLGPATLIGLNGEAAKKSHLMHIQQEKLFKTFANEHLQEYLSLSPNVRVPFGPRDVVFGPYSMYPYLKDDQRYPTMELFELYVRHEVARLMPVTVRLAGVLSRMPAEFNALFDEFDPNRPAGDAPYSILVDSENTLRRANRRLAALEEDWLINLFAYTQNHFYISTAQENFPGIDSSIPEDIYLQYRYHADNFITLLNSAKPVVLRKISFSVRTGH